MPLFENHVGISVSLDGLRLVELVYNNNEFLLENVDELKFDEKLNPSVIDENFINILQNSFQKIISNNSLVSNNISFSLDPEFFQILEVPFENTLLKEDLIEQFRWELSKVKPMLDPAEHLIQHIELEAGDFRKQNFAAVLYLSKKLLGIFSKTAQQHNFKLRYLDYSQSSSNTFVRFLNKSFGSSGMSLLISDNCLAIMILEDYKPVILRKYKKVDSKDFSQILADIVIDLKKVGSDLSSLSYSFVVAKNINSEIITQINSAFTTDIQEITPFNIVKISENFSTEVDLQNQSSRFAPAAGVALRLF